MKIQSILWTLFLTSCALRPDFISLKNGAEKVIISKRPPPKNSKFIKDLESKHGGGCGDFGARGQIEAAVNDLRNQAFDLGADFIQIENVKRPGLENGWCFSQSYELIGKCYKKH